MTKWWQQFANFLHTANLIPLVILVSSYHYYQALRSHDPMLIAIPMALFVDLLHFRTVQRAVQTKKTMWQLTAVFTTSLAFGLQWMFYSQPGEDGVLLWWQTILFASIVPIGLAIMAWHHEQQEEEQITDWQTVIAEAERQAAEMQREAEAERGRAIEMQVRAEAEQERAEKMQRQAEGEQTRTTQMQTRAEAEQHRADEMQARAEREQSRATEMQTRAEAVQAEADAERERADAVQVQLTAVQAEAAQMQTELSAMHAQTQLMQSMGKAWAGMNAEMQTLAFFNADLLSAKEAAAQLAIHETTVRRRAKALNGVKGVS